MPDKAEVAEVAETARGAADRVADVAVKLDDTTTETTKRFDGLSQQVQNVHDLANGMKSELVKEVRESSFAQGVKSEADKKKGTA